MPARLPSLGSQAPLPSSTFRDSCYLKFPEGRHHLSKSHSRGLRYFIQRLVITSRQCISHPHRPRIPGKRIGDGKPEP